MSTAKGFKKILLATDGSEQADAAVDVAIALGRPSSAEVRVVHVWNLEVHRRDGHWEVEVRPEAERLLDDTVARLEAGGLAAEARICRASSDDVATTIVQAAREFGADLVVLGSRGLSDWQSMIKHSVSHQILSALDCAVLVVRARPTGGATRRLRVLLAIAGGDDLAPAVRAAIAAASAPGSKVMVVHVAQAIFGFEGVAFIESDEEIEATMSSAIRLLEDAGADVGGMVAHGAPVAKAVAEIASSWNADLIVVGSSRMGDLGSLVLGSVSHDLLHGAGRPILIAERAKS